MAMTLRPMKTFNVFRRAHRFEAVKQGFSWPGLLAGPVWLFAREAWSWAWVTFGAFMAIEAGSYFVATVPEGPFATGANLVLDFSMLGLFVLTGVCGNRWCEAWYLQDGYRQSPKVTASTRAEAVAAVERGATPVRRVTGMLAAIAASIVMSGAAVLLALATFQNGELWEVMLKGH